MGADVANWLSRVEQTSIQIVVHSDTATTASVTCEIDEVQFGGSLTANVSVNGGNVLFNVTGLTAGTTYGFRCFVDGDPVSVGGSFKTDPLNYNGYRVGWWSCGQGTQSFWNLLNAFEDNLNMALCLGDAGYPDFGNTKYTATQYPPSNSSTAIMTSAENRMGWMLDHQKHPHRMDFSHKVPSLYMYDDHDGVCNNYTGNLNSINRELAKRGSDTVNETEHQQARDATWEAFDAYSLGNPVNTDPEKDADARYFRFTKGNTEFFVLDCGNYRDSWESGDVPNGQGMGGFEPPATCSILGATQLAWYLKYRSESAAVFKVTMFPKKIYGIVTEDNNDDGYINATGEMQTIFDDAVNGLAGGSSEWTEPGGALYCCGDIHTQTVSRDAQHVSFTPCGMASFGHVLDFSDPAFVFKVNYNGWGYLTLGENRITITFKDDLGKVRFEGGVNAGSITLN